MKDLVILLHGFNVFDGGKKTVGRLAPFFDAEKFEVRELNYGYFGFLSTRFLNDNVARKLASLVVTANIEGRRVHLVGHSNGCTIIWLMSQISGWDRIPYACSTTFLNPALERDLPLSATLGHIHVYHAPSDLPVKLSRLLLVPAKFRPWGAMGAYGASAGHLPGRYSSVVNVNMDRVARGLALVEPDRWEETDMGHSGVFKEPALSLFGPRIAAGVASAAQREQGRRG